MFNRKKFPLKERVRFMKKLSFLVESGIPFLQSLHFIHEREERKKMKKHLQCILRSIHSGVSIHKSFETLPYIIDEQSLQIIESGEATGMLSKNCIRISRDLDEKLTNRNRIIGALLYPACILLFAMALALGLLLFVFPKILPLLVFEGATLPFSTRLLISISNFLKEKGMRIGITMMIIVFTFLFSIKRSKALRKGFAHVLLHIPIVSTLLRLFKTSFLSKLLALFLECGYTLSESMYHAERLENNLIYKESFKEILEKIKRGERFSKALKNHPTLFPKETVQFAALGEESGNLSKTLYQLSILFDEELKEIEKRIFSLLEPTLMLFLGATVGFLALSLIMPIYSLTSSLSHASP